MALTRVAPAGIGSTPGTGYVIGDSFLHSRGLNAIDANYTGIVTAQSIRVIGDLQVDGTTTTLDTALTEVDKLEVGANNNTVGVAITQSGTGDILRLYDGTTQVVTVKDGGRFGIGTQNPSDTLDVYKGSSTAYDPTDDDAQRNDGASITIRNDNGATNSFSQLVFDTAGTNQSIARIVAIRSGTSNHLAFVTEHSNTKAERFRITSGGKVGIGTDNPDMALHLYDSTAFAAFTNNGDTGESGILFRRHDNNHNRGKVTYNFTDDALIFRASNNGGGEDLRIDSNGNLGIGTDNPGAQSSSANNLVVADFGGEGGITIKNANDSSGNIFFADTAGSAQGRIQYNHANDYLRFFTGGNNERLRITSAGSVGIGTNNPTDFLSIYGAPVSVWNNSTNTRVWQVGTTNGHGLMKVFRSDAEVIFRVDSSARKVGINTDSPSHSLSSFGSGNSGGVRIENTHSTTTVSGNTASTAFPHNLVLSNYESQSVGSANRMASLGFDVPTPSGVHANATIAFQATNTSGNGDLQFWIEQNNTPVERLRITSAGNIGINDSGPNFHLDVNGNIALREGQVVTWHDGSGNKAGDVYMDSSDNFVIRNTSSVSERLRITSSGYVGIGSISPTGRLDIQDNFENRFAIRLSNTMGTGRTYGFRSHGSNGEAFTLYHGNIRMQHWDDYQAGGNTVFYSGGNESFRVNHNGRIGIGSDNPAYSLDLGESSSTIRLVSENNGTAIRIGAGAGDADVTLIRVDGNAASPVNIHGESNDSAYGFSLKYMGSRSGNNNSLSIFSDNQAGTQAESVTILQDGKIGINVTNPISTLEVNGSIGIQNNQVNTSSITKLFSPSHNTANRGARIRFGLDDGSFAGMQVENVQGDNTSYNSQTVHILTHNGAIAGDIEALTAKYNGNVGIRTDNPTESFHVNGTTRLGGGVDYGSTTILSLAPGVVKWDTPGQSGGRLNADHNGNWYLNNKSYAVYNNLGVNMNDIYGANSGANNIGGWVYLGSTQHSAPYPRKVYKISAPSSDQGTFVYQVWFNGDANYQHGGLYEIRINNWSESNRFTSVTITCINGVSDGLRVYAYNDANGIWITTNSIWGSLYIRKFGYDDSRRSRGSTLCAVDNGSPLATADVNGASGTIPSGYTEVHASDNNGSGGGYNIETNSRFGAGGN